MKRNRWGLGLIVMGYLLLAFAYSTAVPLAETPDESEHFNYLQQIALTHTLPVMQPIYEENVTIEAHQPPLLYLVGAALTSFIKMDAADNLQENICFSFEPDDNGRQQAYFHGPEEWPPQRGVYQVFQLMRWLSVLMGAVTVWLAYMIGRQVFGSDGRFAVIAAALLAFNPQWIFITASLNNDVPSTLLGAAIIYVSILAAQNPRHRLFIVLGVFLGLGFLTKFALLAFWPLAFLAAFVPTLNKNLRNTKYEIRTNLKSLISNLLILTILPILMAGWWYWRNYRLYGDPLMWQVTLAAKGSVIARTTPFTLADLGEFLITHFQSYWLWFGWLNVKGPVWLYWLFLGVVLTAVVGFILLLAKRHVLVNWLAAAFCGLGVLLVYASLLQYIQTINWTGYQGRLAFSAAAPIAVLLALGLTSVNQKWLGTAVAGGFFLVSALAIPLIILPAYPRPQIYQPSADLTRTCIRFEGGLQVEAIAAPEVIRPGEMLPVTIYGWGLETSKRPQPLLLELIGWENEKLGQAEMVLDWQAGELISGTVQLPVAASLPTRGILQLSMGDQSATSATGRVLPLPLALETLKIAPQRPYLPDPAFHTNVQFGESLLLVGFDVAEAAAEVTLYWQALAPMAEDFTTFVHVLAEDGQLLAQDDSQPGHGRYPTSLWAPGEIVAETKSLPTLDGRMVVGVYLLATLERLPVIDPSSSGVNSDQFRLPLPE